MGRAAQRYAKAVLSLAKDRSQTGEVNDEMKLISETLYANKDLSQALKSPAVKDAAKLESLKQIFKNSSETTQSLFNVLVENKRINLLGEVAKKYTQLFNEMNNIQVATVTTAVELTSEMEQKVMSKVHELTGGNASLVNKIEPEILGGFILRIGDLQYDASVSGNLSRLKREFRKNQVAQKKFKSNGISK